MTEENSCGGVSQNDCRHAGHCRRDREAKDMLSDKKRSGAEPRGCEGRGGGGGETSMNRDEEKKAPPAPRRIYEMAN